MIEEVEIHAASSLGGGQAVKAATYSDTGFG